ncbi:MAG: hypothetical protein MUF71_11625 [Candidatus Kapabacteria bacterium]|jgi:hypothetical protein|nr:hypothetical protein [Candidatus Kapabacteria bacterium]
MNFRLQHISTTLLRLLALTSAVLLLAVRTGAWLHIHYDHKHDSHSSTTTTPHSPFTDTSSDDPFTNEADDTHHENCPLCDFLTTSHSEAAIFGALALGLVVVLSYFLTPMENMLDTHSRLRLADRAPPTFFSCL